MNTKNFYRTGSATRLTLVALAALGVAGATLLTGLGLLHILRTSQVLILSPQKDTLALAGTAGMALALFTLTLVLGGLTATRRDRW